MFVHESLNTNLQFTFPLNPWGCRRNHTKWQVAAEVFADLEESTKHTSYTLCRQGYSMYKNALNPETFNVFRSLSASPALRHLHILS